MDPSPTPASQRRDPDSGRVAVPEIAELLHLQRPAAALGATAVVLLALLLTLVAPGLLPANAITGAVVGLLAVLAGVAAAVVLDGRDPVLRGPRHLRRDGHAVLARMAGPDAVRHGGPVLTALGRRLDGKGHHSVLVTGTGTDPSALAVALGRGAAANGHTSLVIDLRSQTAPGVADVGAGTVRLGEAAQLADDRPYAWIGAGVDREAAATAAAGVARRPPRDLELLLVVAPEAATHVPEVLQACERTILLVDADTQQRAMVTARMDALRRAGGRPEAVVVGGLRVVDEEHEGIGGIGTPAAAEPTSTSVTVTTSGSASASASEIRPLSVDPDPDPEPEPATPEREPAPESATPESAAPESAAPDPAPADPGAALADPADDGDGDRDGPERIEPFAPVEPVASDPSTDPVVPPSPEPEPSPAPPPTVPEPHEPDEPEPAPAPEPGPDAPPVVVPDPENREDEDSAAHRLEDTGPLRPITFRTAGADDTSVDGLAEGDPLVTTAALEQLLTRQRRNGS